MKKTKIVSGNLNEIATLIYRKLYKVKDKGWFSKFISEKLIEEYGTNFTKKVLTEQLHTKTKERNKLDDEVKRIAKKLMKVK